MSGGGTNTVTQQSQPPAQFLNAYTNVNNEANGLAQIPYQPYTGATVAPLTAQQTTGMEIAASGQASAQPYMQGATGEINASTAPLLPGVQPYLNSAQGMIGAAEGTNFGASINPYTAGATNAYGAAENINDVGAISPYSAAAAGAYNTAQNANLQSSLTPFVGVAGQTFNNAGSGITYNPVTGSQISQYESPYTSSVVNATQAEFNNQNAQQQQQVEGNAISQGAFGGDRAAVAQGITAGQEALAQAPVIAGLENTGYSQALNEANTQQQTQLQQQQAKTSAQLQGAQGITSLGNQSLTAAQGNLSAQLAAGQGLTQLGSLNLGATQDEAQNQLAAGQGIAGLGSLSLGATQDAANEYMQGAQQENAVGQTALGANEANAWLDSQAGYGLANLGNEAYSQAIGQGNADIAAGGLQQQVEQENLNTSLSQWQAQQAYPYQQVGWQAGIAEGLGGAAGGSSSTTSPGASTASQLTGLGITGLALNGMGAFNGIGSGIGSLIGSGLGAGEIDTGLGSVIAAGISDGGGIAERAPGGGILGFPQHLTRMPGTGRGGITANDNGGMHIPHPMMPRVRLAAGGRTHYRDGGDDDVPIDDQGLPVPPIPPDQMPPIADRGIVARGSGIDDNLPIPPIPPAGGPPPATSGLPAPTSGGMTGGGPPAPPPAAATSGGIAPAPTSGAASPATSDSGSSGYSPWQGLLMAGLGIMGGTSPHALTNIGRGAMEGLQFSEQQRARYEQQALSKLQQQQTAKYQNTELDLKGKQLDQTKQLSEAEMSATQANTEAQREQAMAIAKMHIGMEGANLAETRRYHDLEMQHQSDALNLGKYTYQQVTHPDPDDPTKTISGVLKLPAKGDEAPTFIPTMTDPNKPGSGNSMSGRESVFFSRVAAAGNEAATAASNIVELPLNTSTGWFGGRQQGTGLLGAAKESITNSLTSQSVQDYNTMIAGVSRNLAAIEASGLAPNGTLTHSMDSVILKEGDTPLTQMRKLAEMRQVVEKGLEPNLANPHIPPQQKDVVTGIIKTMQTAIPFTQHDVTMFERNGKPGETLASYASGHNLGNAAAASTPPASAAIPPGETLSSYASGHNLGNAAAASTPPSLPFFRSPADARKLPSGSQFYDPDGNIRTVP